MIKYNGSKEIEVTRSSNDCKQYKDEGDIVKSLKLVFVPENGEVKYIKGENYSFYISLSVSDYLIDWSTSKVDKQFFIDRFNSLKPLTNWAGSSVMQIREEVMGAFQCKRYAHMECTNATHFIWLDTDICFDDKILYYMEASINRLNETDKHIDKYFDELLNPINIPG